MFKLKKLSVLNLLLFIYIIKSVKAAIDSEENSGNCYEDIESDNRKCENTVEKIHNLFESFKQMDPKTINLIMQNMDTFEKHLRKVIEEIIEDKLREKYDIIDEIIESKLSKRKHNDEIPSESSSIQKRAEQNLTNINYNFHKYTNNICKITFPPLHQDIFEVACDLKTDDGGWIIIQRRQDGSENFNRNWYDYEKGFGDLNGEFFIGLKNLYLLTKNGVSSQLRIMLEDFEGNKAFAKYDEFKIGSEKENYKLTVGKYSGTAGDSLTPHNGLMFSTYDRDNDMIWGSCGKFYKSGWWFSQCYNSNLNGEYLQGDEGVGGIIWLEFRGHTSLKFVQMMIRAKGPIFIFN